MRLRREPGHAQLPLQDDRQVLTLGVEGAGHILDVREARPVLEMEERRLVLRPGHDVGSAGELVVLVGMVHGDDIPVLGEEPSLQLAHGGVHEVSRLASLVSTSIRDAHLERESEGRRDAGIDIQRGAPSGFDRVHRCRGDARPLGELPHRERAAVALLADGRPDTRREPISEGGSRWHRRTCGAAWRHRSPFKRRRLMPRFSDRGVPAPCDPAAWATGTSRFLTLTEQGGGIRGDLRRHRAERVAGTPGSCPSGHE